MRYVAVSLCLLCPAVLACTSHDCSDDSLPVPVIGNETIAWDFTGYDTATEFELSVDDGATVCYRGTPDWFDNCLEQGPKGRCRQWGTAGMWFSATPCAPEHNKDVCVRVRACSGSSCSAWSTDCVGFRGHPWVTFRGR